MQVLVIITKIKYLNSILFLIFKTKHCSKGTICTYPSQQRFRMNRHLREKEVLSGTISLENVCSIWQELSGNVSFV